MITGDISDLKNSTTGGRGAGSITAALFLNEFIGNYNNNETNSESNNESNNEINNDKKQINWAHIDMAGPVWHSSKRQATGYGVKLLTKYILNMNK